MAPDLTSPLLGRSESCHHLGTHLDHPSDHHHGFGAKSISFWGSCALNFNNATGTALVILPLLYQQAGWVTPTVGLLVMYVLSSFAASMLCEAVQRIPGNRGFSRRWEYCNVVNHFYGPKAYAAAQVGFNATLQAANISAMIVTAQVMDGFVRDQLGVTYGFNYGAWPPQFVQSAGLHAESACTWGELPGGACNANVISLGFVLCMAICIPFGWMNLEDNMGFQWLSCIGTIVFTLEFIYEFIKRVVPGAPLYCPGNGPSRTPPFLLQQHQVLGICVFAYSYVCTVPSWLNEKKPGVNVNRAIWLPVAGAVAISMVMGFLGGWSFRLVDAAGAALGGTEDILKVLDAKAAPETTCHWAQPRPLLQYSIVAWAFLGYVPQIPIQAINVRYNLQSGGVAGPTAAFFWGVVAPWIGTAFLYQREVLSRLANWTSILVGTFINFIVPPLLYRAACQWYPSEEEEEEELKKEASVGKGRQWDLPRLQRGPLETVVSGVVLQDGAPVLINVADSSDELHSGRRPALTPAASEETIQKTCGVCKRSVSFVVRASHLDEPPVNAVPKWLKVNPRRLVTAMVIVLAILTSGGAVSSLLYKDST